MKEKTSFRPITTDERSIIERLLGLDFPGRDSLRIQLEHARVREIDDDGCLEIRVDSELKADVPERVPTEGEYTDEDGITVHVLLHIVDQQLSELEVYKEDNSKIERKPNANRLQLAPSKTIG